MKRTNVLQFRRRSRRPSRPAGPPLLDNTTVAGQLQRLALSNPRAADWLIELLHLQAIANDVRCVPVGRDFVVTISPPIQMAKADIADEENEQLA